MLRSMADPFELNAAFLCVPTREKAKEQSPPALLFCIRINHFPLLCPEHSGGHFKSFLLGSVELCLDLCRGCRTAPLFAQGFRAYENVLGRPMTATKTEEVS